MTKFKRCDADDRSIDDSLTLGDMEPGDVFKIGYRRWVYMMLERSCYAEGRVFVNLDTYRLSRVITPNVPVTKVRACLRVEE